MGRPFYFAEESAANYGVHWFGPESLGSNTQVPLGPALKRPPLCGVPDVALGEAWANGALGVRLPLLPVDRDPTDPPLMISVLLHSVDLQAECSTVDDMVLDHIGHRRSSLTPPVPADRSSYGETAISRVEPRRRR